MSTTVLVSHSAWNIDTMSSGCDKKNGINSNPHDYILNQSVSKRLGEVLNAGKHDDRNEDEKRKRPSVAQFFRFSAFPRKGNREKESNMPTSFSRKYVQHQTVIKKSGNPRNLEIFNEFVDEWNSCENACCEYSPTIFQHIEKPVSDFLNQFEKMGKKLHKYDEKALELFKQNSLDPMLTLRYDLVNKARLISSTRNKWIALMSMVSEVGIDNFKKNRNSIEHCNNIIDTMLHQSDSYSVSEVEHLAQEVEYHSEDIYRFINRLKNWNWRASTEM